MQLYKEVDNTGVLDAGDGAPIATTVTATGTGAYSFTGLNPTGTYFVAEVLPANEVCTYPTNTSYYTIVATPGGTSSGNNFDNFICPSSSNVTNISYIINGTTSVTNLRGATAQGDQVTVVFTVTSGTATVTLVSYTAPGSTFSSSTASQQQIFQEQTGTFGPGTYTLTVQLPNAYYQIDFVDGAAINQLGPSGSNIFYSSQNRLFSADNEGTRPEIANTGSLAGTVYFDANNNGVFDSGDSGITSVIVTLSGTETGGTAVHMVRTTDANGNYSFLDLRPGTYTITETQPANYSEGHDNLGSLGGNASVIDIFSAISLGTGANGVNYDFGEVMPPSSLSGFVWVDLNDDGKIDFNEQVLANVTIQLHRHRRLRQRREPHHRHRLRRRVRVHKPAGGDVRHSRDPAGGLLGRVGVPRNRRRHDRQRPVQQHQPSRGHRRDQLQLRQPPAQWNHRLRRTDRHDRLLEQL